MLTRSLLSAVALLALAACSERKADTATADTTADATVDIGADTDTGKVEISLPGGIEAKVSIPGAMVDKAKFDIDGIGLYPGAKIGLIKVNAMKREDEGSSGHDATVSIGFTAPADAAAVADWYQQQFDTHKISVRRTGETLSGKTKDGDDFTLALAQVASGAQGTLTIQDTN